MIIFLIKLIAAPLLLALATLAARRWGTVLGGILIGLPLISGPISVFLAIENGAGFAVETARGALAGTVALAVFTCVYAAVCPKGWLKASFLSVALYVLASWIAAELPISAVTLAVSAAAAIVLSLWIMPIPHSAAVKHRPPKHDLLMRMGMMMVLMIAITFLAPYIGPTASGIASTFPYMALTMAVFSQIQGGPDDARRKVRPPAEGGDEPLLGAVGHGIDGKIPPGKVFLHVRHNVHRVRVAAIRIGTFGAERRGLV